MSDQAFGFGISFGDLYDKGGLSRLDSAFLTFVKEANAELAVRLNAARTDPAALPSKDESQLILDLAPQVDAFVGRLFKVEAELAERKTAVESLAPVAAAKRQFIVKRASRAHSPEDAAALDGSALTRALEAKLGGTFDELHYARSVLAWEEAGDEAALSLATDYAAWALHAKEGKRRHKHSVLFNLPGKHDPHALFTTETTQRRGVAELCFGEEDHRAREGFALTDHGADLLGAMGEANYCILCHHQGKDSCSKGLKEKGSDAWAVSEMGRTLTGCPLQEKISEMHEAKRDGLTVAPVAIITIDNPMCAGTGHRICNDCMTACVYQNQNRTTVNIPQVETRALKDVLELPFGFEILGLLTRWNPLNFARPLPRPDTGSKVLVAGLGPAGYTLAHHLLNDGHAVVALDGLKVEPLPPELCGVKADGSRVPFKPIKDVTELWQGLDHRVTEGFGGVAEYGITVRWDKNFLRVNRLLLERRAEFAMYGGVRLGGQITFDQAFAMGFDHIALCLGAGKPTILDMKNNLAKGVRQASDFLMALQLTGAGRKDSIANLQIRLPVAVIGGGLTAIDACTEALAYYPIQVEKFLARFESLAAEKGEAAVRAGWTDEEKEIAEEFISHARAIRAERAVAAAEDRPANVRGLLDGWGGSTILYRRKMTDSPAYRNNPEEIVKAFEEGIGMAEQWSPEAVEVDGFGYACGLKVKHIETKEEKVFPAKTVITAAGTVPNITLSRENTGLKLDGKYFQAVDANGAPIKPEKVNKPTAPQMLTQLNADGSAISFFGDQHPSFAGNVVGAMGSAKQGYSSISALLAKKKPSAVAAKDLVARLDHDLRATVHAVERLTPTIVEVVVKAPAAARNFKPGQFFRLQNYETHALKVENTTLAAEGLALTGAWVDVDKGLLAMIVLEMGGSSDLVNHLRVGEPVIVMGPTGAPTETHGGETVLLIGGGLGNAVLFSIGKAFRAAGSKVLYFAGYKNPFDRFKIDEVEDASDVIVWCCDSGQPFPPNRPQDKSFIGNIVQCLTAYADGSLGPVTIPLSAVDRIIVIGSDRMMHAVGKARHAVLEPFLKKDHVGIASINAPMQCMLKEICAQCLTAHVDPKTGERTVVFSCFNQDQLLDNVDFAVLRDRLSQNTLQEKLTKQWIDHCLKKLGKR